MTVRDDHEETNVTVARQSNSCTQQNLENFGAVEIPDLHSFPQSGKRRGSACDRRRPSAGKDRNLHVNNEEAESLLRLKMKHGAPCWKCCSRGTWQNERNFLCMCAHTLVTFSVGHMLGGLQAQRP